MVGATGPSLPFYMPGATMALSEDVIRAAWCSRFLEHLETPRISRRTCARKLMEDDYHAQGYVFLNNALIFDRVSGLVMCVDEILPDNRQKGEPI